MEQNQAYQQDWVTGYQPVPGDFSVAVIPDTQELAAQYHDKLRCIMAWIADHKERENIRFAIDLGDVTWNGHLQNDLAHNEYTASVAAHDLLLSAGLEYSLCYGNHDFTPVNGQRDTALLNRYFGKVKTFSAFGGAKEPDKIDNTFFTFTAEGKDFLVLSLECCPLEDTVAWANRVVEDHPRHNVIVATHAYLNIDGQRMPYGEDLWNGLIKRHPNIFLTVCGHMENHADPGSMAWRQDMADHGNTVVQTMSNAQDIDVERGGVGLLLMVRFREGGRVLDFNYFSPPNNSMAYKKCNQFSVTLPEGQLL